MTDRSFTPQQFLDWARTKDPSEHYDYCNNENCPLAQFVRETGRYKNPCVGITDIDEWGGPTVGCIPDTTFNCDDRLPNIINDDGDHAGWTFGALVSRLEEALVS